MLTNDRAVLRWCDSWYSVWSVAWQGCWCLWICPEEEPSRLCTRQQDWTGTG